MKKTVILSVRGRQAYLDQEPDEIELVTEGVLEFDRGIWKLEYEESELTGLAGVTTSFLIEPVNWLLKSTTLTFARSLTRIVFVSAAIIHLLLYSE